MRSAFLSKMHILTHTHLHLHSIHISDICEPAYMLYAELLPHFNRTDNF